MVASTKKKSPEEILWKAACDAVRKAKTQLSGKSGKISLAINLQEGRIRSVGVSVDYTVRIDDEHDPI